MATWPDISTIQYGSLVMSPSAAREVFEHDLGPPATAALMDDATDVSFDLILTGAELSTFQSWLEVDLECGAVEFTGLEGVVGDEDSVYQFRSLPQFRVIRGGGASARLWRGTVDLIRMGAA